MSRMQTLKFTKPAKKSNKPRCQQCGNNLTDWSEGDHVCLSCDVMSLTPDWPTEELAWLRASWKERERQPLVAKVVLASFDLNRSVADVYDKAVAIGLIQPMV